MKDVDGARFKKVTAAYKDGAPDPATAGRGLQASWFIRGYYPSTFSWTGAFGIQRLCKPRNKLRCGCSFRNECKKMLTCKLLKTLIRFLGLAHPAGLTV